MKPLIRFYTSPPTQIEWPWILLSLNTYQTDKNKRNTKAAIHLIIDSGVDKWFFIEKRTDYPDEYHIEAPKQFEAIQKQWGDKVRITIPDYPDDYNPGQTWENGQDNVAKTLKSIEKYTTLLPDLNWMPVAQSRYLDFESFSSNLDQIGKHVDRYGWVGLGSACKTHKIDFIRKCVMCLEKEFPNANRHAFGATSEAYPIIRHHITSFDSTAYSWYTGRHKAGKMMVTSQLERQQAFIGWSFMMNKKFGLPDLTSEVPL